MCYGYQWIENDDGEKFWVDYKTYKRWEEEGKVSRNKDDFFYPKNMVPAVVQVGKNYQMVPMRFDLIPREYLTRYKDFTLAEVIKKKNSRAKNPDNDFKPWGFDSFNARSETIKSKFSFNFPWKQGLRCVMPATAWLERPNEDYTPPEVTGKEYKLTTPKTVYMGAIFDIHARGNDTLHSLAIVTLPSDGHKIRREIYHSRIPLVMDESQALEWLSPTTTPERAWEMIVQYPEDQIEITERLREKKAV